MSAEIGDEVSQGAVWSWVQKSGKALRREEDRRRETVFGDGEMFEGESEEKEIVVLHTLMMDATMFHSQEKGRQKLMPSIQKSSTVSGRSSRLVWQDFWLPSLPYLVDNKELKQAAFTSVCCERPLMAF